MDATFWLGAEGDPAPVMRNWPWVDETLAISPEKWKRICKVMRSATLIWMPNP